MDKKANTTIFIYVEMILGVILVVATIPMLQNPQKMQTADKEFSALATVQELRAQTYFTNLLTQKFDIYTYPELLVLAPNNIDIQQQLRTHFTNTFKNSEPLKLTLSSSTGTITLTNKEAKGTYRIVTQKRTIQYGQNIYDITLEVYFAK